MKKIKVLHAPTAVGGNPPALSKALRKQGIDSECCIITQNYLAYEVDRVLVPTGARFLRCELTRLKFIFECLFKYDIIHYNAGTTIATANIIEWPGKTKDVSSLKRFVYSAYLRGLQYFEVSLFKLFRKKLFLTYQGDDARQGDYCRQHYAVSIATQVDETYYSDASDAFKRQNIRYLARHCEQVYSLNPDLLNVLPASAKFVPYSHVFFDTWRFSCDGLMADRPLRIVHAPTHRRVKGTDLILEALESLKQEGLRFELTLVEGLSQAEARKRYEEGDVLIDQLFAGWYGGLAVELMALGKPVMVYLREEDLRFIPEQMRAELPFINVDPLNVKERLREVLTMPREQLVELAKRSRAFVEKWHDPARIAALISDDYHASTRAPASV
ncbi:glycosyltransferase family 1 protein [Pseudomonas sichuanensis]|uniref:glycosyltransferase family 1 protein n=1 Tax=Pseudomonas sichuanensis TaxID=2213015 RepID=UPI0024485262|nr:glycosyltransferase family 1 protein [Pseudomonas sichuanensis]MDH0732176.1 glycosyltransferase family 1 protein [Pseudomonas sichuanensis]MDH1584895.1 glycosyltransferase family 1 protein [Pseudomonas sichuanensis]MDH1592883.1 glycosyltransferase family 1 protein [Pseudomonas sichuanensis]MDH1599838.1 glycosyltransferase family 1 protein [Pseudomonas sichuanensis]